MYVYLKWDIEMMTSRLRAAVSRELNESRMEISVVSKWGRIVFLQELLRSCGKQSSVSSKVSITRERRTCWALAAFWPKLSVIQLIYYYPSSPALLPPLLCCFLLLHRDLHILTSLFILLIVDDFGLCLSPYLAICQMSQVKVGWAKVVNVALCERTFLP